jgi:hypothetical protein
MKIYYGKTETRGDVTVEIKAEDFVNFEIESKEEAFTRVESFVNERIQTERF